MGRTGKKKSSDTGREILIRAAIVAFPFSCSPWQRCRQTLLRVSLCNWWYRHSSLESGSSQRPPCANKHHMFPHVSLINLFPFITDAKQKDPCWPLLCSCPSVIRRQLQLEIGGQGRALLFFPHFRGFSGTGFGTYSFQWGYPAVLL